MERLRRGEEGLNNCGINGGFVATSSKMIICPIIKEYEKVECQ
jgi:hypothetical protein